MVRDVINSNLVHTYNLCLIYKHNVTIISLYSQRTLVVCCVKAMVQNKDIYKLFLKQRSR